MVRQIFFVDQRTMYDTLDYSHGEEIIIYGAPSLFCTLFFSSILNNFPSNLCNIWNQIINISDHKLIMWH